jgi:pyruvate/2-oxoglutarate dehydrogenase complex dihydrolipoamide dehydrogenase (E3) component
MAIKYDAIVIGAGQAGPSLAVRLADTGMKAAIIERKRFGGTCVNNGCIPTKTLVASAKLPVSQKLEVRFKKIRPERMSPAAKIQEQQGVRAKY